MIDHFFIVGAQRCGTTYLYKILEQHPEIEMAYPFKPEPKYFIKDNDYKQGISTYIQKYFGRKKNIKLRGEKSTSYIEIETAAQRIAANFSKAKIIFILRDPIERALSNYYFTVANGYEKMPLNFAFLNEENRIDQYDKTNISVSPYAYLARGKYINYLRTYQKYFSREQMIILTYEKFINSMKEISKLYSKLEVDSEYMPENIASKVNNNENKELEKAELPFDLKYFLENYFAEANQALAVEFGVDISLWR